MEKRTTVTLVATFVLISWLSQIGYIVLPLKNDSANTAASGLRDLVEENPEALRWMNEAGQPNEITPAEIKEQVKRELWKFWFVQSGVIVLGIVAGLAAFFRFTYWRAAIIATSVLYLVHWVYAHKAILSSPGLIQAYKLLWDVAAKFGSTFDFVHRDVLLPVFYLAIIVFLAGWRSGAPWNGGSPVSRPPAK